MRALLLSFLILLAASAAYAVDPGEQLKDPVQEARARDISKELRCLVCQNQSIDDSNADLAKDLRRIVRERIVAGDNDRQVVDYIVARVSVLSCGVTVYPGENEMGALVKGALRVLSGKERAKEYRGRS